MNTHTHVMRVRKKTNKDRFLTTTAVVSTIHTVHCRSDTTINCVAALWVQTICMHAMQNAAAAQ